FEVPQRQVFQFVGRETILEEIKQCFDTSAVVVLRGMGGQGKTQLALDRYGTSIELVGMSVDESVDLFFNRVQMDDQEEHVEDAREIARRLGYHPLAIDQAAAYFNKRKTTLGLTHFLLHYKQRRKEILSSVPNAWEYKRKEDGSEQEVALSVYTTWHLSYEQLRE
ncbi:hypothetical protein K491DRAFT_556753, partial [Lophiostoma macrostomum CBS 122681]